MNEIEISPIGSDAEAQECAAIMAASEPWTTLGRTFEECLAHLRDTTREVYVARNGEPLAGFIVVNMRGAFVGYIQIVCVAPERRGSGVGTSLMRFAERRIFAVSPNVFLCVSSFNTGARKLYERLGYQVVGDLDDYLVRGHSETLMRKTTGPILKR